MSISPETISSNLAAIRQRIAEAAQRSGRSESDIQLVAVTKYVDADITRMLVQAGCNTLGESRPQVLWKKADELADCQIQWHQIGHMQRNKLARTLPLISLLHSVDSERLLESVDEQSAKLGVTSNILLEVNISGDESKHGFAPAELPMALEKSANLANVSVNGIMGMASRVGGVDRARRDFAALRELRDSLAPNYASEMLTEISMGMSGDFDVAIEEGATIVRVGSALFG